MSRLKLLVLATAFLSVSANADTPRSIEPAPERGHGEGSFTELILRNATLVSGTGAPARGPVDIVIRNNRISEVRSVGNPGVAIKPEKRPEASPETR